MAVVKTADVLIIGSGPAAIASAWPMVEAGLVVLMLEARSDLQAVTPPRDRPSRAELRRIPLRDRGAQAWSLLLGDDLRVLKPHDHSLPKLRFLLGDDGVSRFIADSQIVANNFSAIGVFARGGLSNVWGAGASAFDQDELSDLPFPASELEPSFRAVAQRIGISGSLTDDLADYHGSDIPVQPPLELSPLMRTLLGRYENERQHLSFRLGRSRLAVLSVDHGGRRKCKLDGMCAYGCGEKSIYNSADELPDLESRSNFTCHDNARVTRIESRADGYKITTAGPDASSGPTYRASRVVVAAGVLNTTRLVLRLLEHFDADVPLLDIPTISFGLILPGRLGSGLPTQGFALSQLAFKCAVASDQRQYASGSLYAGDHFQASDLIPRIPFSYPAARTTVRSIMPALLFGTMWFPSTYGRSRVRLERHEGTQDHRLVVNGGFALGFGDVSRATLRSFKKQLRRLGVYSLPGGVEPFAPGGAARIGGTLPMGSWTTADGEVVGAPNLFVADSASPPCLHPKSVVLTAMANADRIGRIVAARVAGVT